MENYSLSDIAAISGNGMNGGNCWILILLFAMIYGNGGGLFGNRNVGDYSAFASAASQQEILYGQRFSQLESKADGLAHGISDATFALNNALTTEGRAIQTQIAECCCATKEAIHAEGEKTRDLLQQNKIESLQAQINALQMQANMCNVVRYPNSMSFNAGTSPFCANGGCGGNNNI